MVLSLCRAPCCGIKNKAQSLLIRGPLTALRLPLRYIPFSCYVSEWFSQCHSVISWFTPSTQDEKRPIRRVRSPSKPRAWLSTAYKPKFEGRLHRPQWECFLFYFCHWAVLMITLTITNTALKTFRLCWWCRFARDDHSFYKPVSNSHKYHHFTPRGHFHRRDHPYNLHHAALREREREKEKERYEHRESTDRSSPPKQNSSK